jgi:hypothetical protein
VLELLELGLTLNGLRREGERREERLYAMLARNVQMLTVLAAGQRGGPRLRST